MVITKKFLHPTRPDAVRMRRNEKHAMLQMMYAVQILHDLQKDLKDRLGMIDGGAESLLTYFSLRSVGHRHRYNRNPLDFAGAASIRPHGQGHAYGRMERRPAAGRGQPGVAARNPPLETKEMRK